MTVTLPFVIAVAIAVIGCYRYMDLKPWHLLVFAGLLYLFLPKSAGPVVLDWINSLFRGRHL